MKNIRILMKSAIPRTMNVVQEGCRFKLQKRDFGVISDASWNSAISDSMWLSKKCTYQFPNSRLLHLIPTLDGSPGIPFQNEVNRYLVNKPGDFVSLPKEDSLLLRLENVINTLITLSPSNLTPKQQFLCKPKTKSKAVYTDYKSPNDCQTQQKWEKSLTNSIGLDDEALCFSTNFVLMAFLFLTVVLLRDI